MDFADFVKLNQASIILASFEELESIFLNLKDIAGKAFSIKYFPFYYLDIKFKEVYSVTFESN